MRDTRSTKLFTRDQTSTYKNSLTRPSITGHSPLPQRIHSPLTHARERHSIHFSRVHYSLSMPSHKITERTASLMKHSYPYRETMESMLVEQQSLRFPHRFPFDVDQLQSSAAAAAAASNLTLEDKAMWAARSQIFLRAAAAAAVSPYAQLVNPALVYPSVAAAAAAGSSHQQPQQAAAVQHQQQQLGHLWWASSLGPTLFAAAHHHQQQQQQQQLAASASQHSPGGGGGGSGGGGGGIGGGPAAPRPVYPSPMSGLSHHRFSPYTSPRAQLKSATQIGLSRSQSPSRRTTPSPTDSLSREAQDLSPS